MNLLMKLRCWFYGHEPGTASISVPVIDDLELEISVCKYCDAGIVFDEQLLGWVKW